MSIRFRPSLDEHALVSLLRRDGHIDCGIDRKEIDGFQPDEHLLAWHDRPVFDTRIMRLPESMPNDNIFVPHTCRLTAVHAMLDPRRNPLSSWRLHRVLPCWEQFILVESRHPNSAASELGSFGVI